MRRARLIPLFLCLVRAAPALAQWPWQLTGETGASRVQQQGLPEATTFTLGGTAATGTERTLLHSSLLGARTSDNRWTGQWVGIGAATTPSLRGWQLQANGALSAFAQTFLRPTTSADLSLQLRGGDSERGLAVGAGGGRTAHNAVSIPVRRATADAWWSLGPERVSASLASTRTRSVFGDVSILVDESRRDVTYLDLSGAWRHELGGWSGGIAAGLRGSNNSLSDARSWMSVDGAMLVTPRVALVATVGRSLEDLVRGVPRANYAGISLRFSSLAHARAFARLPAGPRIAVSRVGANARLDVSVPSGSVVELMGDFTEWSPVQLERVGKSWRLERAIPAGSHRLAIRVDGGEWIVPVNLPRVEDDLAGAVGLIVIPGGRDGGTS